MLLDLQRLLLGLLVKALWVLAIFAAGYIYGYRSQETARLEMAVEQLKHNEKVLNDESRLAVKQNDQLFYFDNLVKENGNALTGKDDVCFDAADTDRLRNLWGEKSTAPSADFNNVLRQSGVDPRTGFPVQSKDF